MTLFGKRRIFLDFAGGRDNPSGIHREGSLAKKKLEEARQKVARTMHCQTRDVVFTSGATESDNLAILGVFEALKNKVKKPHIIISRLEHPAVLESLREAERRGAELQILPHEKIVSNIKENTILVSITYGSSETGQINPVAKIAREIKTLRKERGTKYPFIHSDVTQAAPFFPVDIERVGVDLLTLDGLLITKSNVEIRPIVFGGGQERGVRSGTENLESIREFAEDLREMQSNWEEESKKVEKLKKLFLHEVQTRIPKAVINTPKLSLPNIVSLTIPGVLHEFLAIKLDQRGVAVSTGSSCDSMKSEKDKEALRFSFSKETTENDIKKAIRILEEVVI